jgi:hypothetical protein
MTIKRTAAIAFAFLLIAVSILTGCDQDTKTTAPEDSAFAAWCQETVDNFKSLQPGGIPDNLMQNDSSKTGGEFDTNTYFSVLTHLSVEEGYVLDWVYRHDGSAGSPILYARPTDATPYKNYHEFAEAADTYTRPENDISLVWFVMGEETGVFSNKIKTDGTAEGYFEYTVLQLLGQQFYLFWHANYNDTRIVCEPAALESILSYLENTEYKPIDNGFKKDARKIDLQPTVKYSGDMVTVSVVVFSDWGGFSRCSCTMYKEYPHTVIGFEEEALLEYNCGIMF